MSRITKLSPNEVFVFGSNDAGIHGKGAARDAIAFGARWNIGRGPCGQTYAIATKNRYLKPHPLYVIEDQVREFVAYARDNIKTRFLLTPIGCGYAGYTPQEIAPLFFLHTLPTNIIMPPEFLAVRNATGELNLT